MNKNPTWDCLVCFQPLNNAENPDKCLCCGFEHLPGIGMDEAALREIYSEDTDSFEKRYPYAKDIKYLKPRKEWIS